LTNINTFVYLFEEIEMKKIINKYLLVCTLLAGIVSSAITIAAETQSIQLGPRPFFLVEDMDASPLKERLQQCVNGPFVKTDFSISHRGAALQFPEHTKESYEAAIRMGAGIVECDVTFTKDRELVCRHSQADLHTTTNILATPLAQKCTAAFTPYNKNTKAPATAECRTSDITLAEFKTLKGKMDASNPKATTVAEYLDGTANYRTDLYATSGTLLSHKESIALFKKLGVKFTPELKSASVEMPYEGTFTQANYAQAMINDYLEVGVDPRDVWPQSFNLDDVNYWIANEPAFGEQAVYLDNRVYRNLTFKASLSDFEQLKSSGVNIIAPPIFALLATDAKNKIVPSEYALMAKQAGLDIIAWSIERSGPLNDIKNNPFYYSSVLAAVNNEGDIYNVIDVLAQDVGVIGIFSDWPATTTYYANCMGLK
jgi:glycerophosphoryl diester phosphodiesterase